METENNHKKPKVNPEDYKDGSHKPFKKGNPGRPKGCLNKDTIARNAIIDTFNSRTDELKNLEFKQLVNAVVTLLPKKIEGDVLGGCGIIMNLSERINELEREQVKS